MTLHSTQSSKLAWLCSLACVGLSPTEVHGLRLAGNDPSDRGAGAGNTSMNTSAGASNTSAGASGRNATGGGAQKLAAVAARALLTDGHGGGAGGAVGAAGGAMVGGGAGGAVSSEPNPVGTTVPARAPQPCPRVAAPSRRTPNTKLGALSGATLLGPTLPVTLSRHCCRGLESSSRAASQRQ